MAHRSPHTCLRGEGANLAEAEESALRQWERINACPGHEYEPRDCKNGGGFCKHCDLFQYNLYTWPCRECGTATNYDYHDSEHGTEYLCKACSPDGQAMTRWLAVLLAEAEAHLQGEPAP